MVLLMVFISNVAYLKEENLRVNLYFGPSGSNDVFRWLMNDWNQVNLSESSFRVTLLGWFK